MWRSEMDQAKIQIYLENFVGILCQVSAQSTLLFRQIIFHQKYPDKPGPPRGGGGAKGAICPGPPAKGAPHKRRMKYAVKINSNTLTECTILLFLGPQISKIFRGRMPPDPPNA